VKFYHPKIVLINFELASLKEEESRRTLTVFKFSHLPLLYLAKPFGNIGSFVGCKNP
jgi:hypothetical protein